MNESATRPLPDVGAGPGKGLNIALWCVQGLLALAFVGAALLATVMLGAIATHLFILHNAPTAPLALLLLASFVVWGRRQELARLLGR